MKLEVYVRFAAAAVVLLVANGCSSSNPDRNPTGGGPPAGQGEQAIALRIEPEDYTLDLVPGAAVDYHVYAVYADSLEREVTDQITISVSDPTTGTFLGGRFSPVSQKGQRVIVRAALVEGSAVLVRETLLILRLRQDLVDSSPGSFNLPLDIAQRFETAKAGPVSNKPIDFVYPNDGVLVPPNLQGIEYHFKAPSGHRAFELTFSNAITDVRVYLGCVEPASGGCIYPAEPTLWEMLATTNRGDEPLEVRVRSMNNLGTELAQSDPVHVTIVHDDLAGALFYWTTTGRAIMRWDFGSTTQTQPDKIVDQNDVGGCPGCHSLSRDGTKMVVEKSGEPWGGNVLWDIAAGAPKTGYTPSPTMFSSWNPAGDQYVGVPGSLSGTGNTSLGIYDGSTGVRTQVLSTTGDATHPANFPDWSPDGTRIAFVRVGIRHGVAFIYKGQIEMISQMTGGWAMPEVIVPWQDGVNNLHPSFAPDGALIAFTRSTCPPGTSQDGDCDGYSDPSARIYVVEPRTGATAIDLENLNAPGKADGSTTKLTNSYPKWSPFQFRRTATSRLEWVAFSSSRRYGLREPPTDYTQYIWMAGIDPDLAAAGQDPSSPAFLMPYQGLDNSNHIPQWSEVAVPIPIN